MLAALALCAAPAGLAAPPAPLPHARGAGPGPLASSLHAAATATADELSATAAEAPGRAARALREAAAAALAPLAPEAPIARARAGLTRLEAWRSRARTVATTAATLRRLTAAAGGPAAALDRALDAVAAVGLALFALRLARRRRVARSHDPIPVAAPQRHG